MFFFSSDIPDHTFHGLVFGAEAEHSEHHQSGQHRGEEVNRGDSEGITMAVVVLGIIGGVGDDRPEAETQSKEHLSGCLSPHLHVGPDLQLEE